MVIQFLLIKNGIPSKVGDSPFRAVQGQDSKSLLKASGESYFRAQDYRGRFPYDRLEFQVALVEPKSNEVKDMVCIHM